MCGGMQIPFDKFGKYLLATTQEWGILLFAVYLPRSGDVFGICTRSGTRRYSYQVVTRAILGKKAKLAQ